MSRFLPPPLIIPILVTHVLESRACFVQTLKSSLSWAAGKLLFLLPIFLNRAGTSLLSGYCDQSGNLSSDLPKDWHCCWNVEEWAHMGFCACVAKPHFCLAEETLPVKCGGKKKSELDLTISARLGMQQAHLSLQPVSRFSPTGHSCSILSAWAI